MLNEITIPNDYTGTIEQENTIVGKINENFTQLEEKISLLNESSLSFETHIVDYEEYEIDIYFSNNKTKATISVQDENIKIEINNKIIEIDSYGNIV